MARDFRLLTARNIALTGKTRRGLEADQKVIAAHGCYAMTATTALTAQNTQGVFGIHETPTAFVQQQIEAVVEDVGVDVVKTGIDSWFELDGTRVLMMLFKGMLASATTVSLVAKSLREHNITKSVVDPVCHHLQQGEFDCLLTYRTGDGLYEWLTTSS